MQKVFYISRAFEFRSQSLKNDKKMWLSHLVTVSVCETYVNPVNNKTITFRSIENVVMPHISKLKGKDLNEVLNTPKPTAEYLCDWLYEKIKNELKVQAIEIKIGQTSCCKMEIKN